MPAALRERQELLAYASLAAISLSAGLLVARSPQTIALPLLAVLALAALTVLASLPVRAVFISWLFLAPLFQNSADATSLGRALTWALYIGPALLFAVLTIVRPARALSVSAVDWLPGVYLVYAVVSIVFTTDMLRADPGGSAKAVFTILAVGPIIYYFLTFGPGLEIAGRTIAAALLLAGILQGIFAAAEMASGWTLWGQPGWQVAEGGARATATLANPGVLGMLLGSAIVIAVSVLTWNGPVSLRGLSWLTLAVCTPGLLLTLTRGPVLATSVAVVLVLLLGRARLVAVGVLAASALTLAFLFPTLQQTDLYRERVAQARTVETRVALQRVSLELAEEKPLLGWGYGSFDRVKNESGITVPGVPLPSVLGTTSHDTYLTILVELGTIGLLLFCAPFAVLSLRGIRRGASADSSWLLAAALGSLVVVFATASTLDFRFFSFAQMLPFVFLALLRGGQVPRRNA